MPVKPFNQLRVAGANLLRDSKLLAQHISDNCRNIEDRIAKLDKAANMAYSKFNDSKGSFLSPSLGKKLYVAFHQAAKQVNKMHGVAMQGYKLATQKNLPNAKPLSLMDDCSVLSGKFASLKAHISASLKGSVTAGDDVEDMLVIDELGVIDDQAGGKQDEFGELPEVSAADREILENIEGVMLTSGEEDEEVPVEVPVEEPEEKESMRASRLSRGSRLSRLRKPEAMKLRPGPRKRAAEEDVILDEAAADETEEEEVVNTEGSGRLAEEGQVPEGFEEATKGSSGTAAGSRVASVGSRLARQRLERMRLASSNRQSSKASALTEDSILKNIVKDEILKF
jgi:hypothetical protein